MRPAGCGDLRQAEGTMSPLVRVYVLDTNALLNDPEVIFAFSGAEVIVPGVVLDELDALKHRREDRRLRYHGRIATRLLFDLTRDGHLLDGVELENGATLRLDRQEETGEAASDLDLRRADDRILAVALRHDRLPGVRATLVTNDLNLILRAEALGLDTYRFEGKLERVRSRRIGYMEWLRLHGVTLLLGFLTLTFAVTTGFLLITRPSASSSEQLSVADAGQALETLGATADQLEQYYRARLEQDPSDAAAAVRLGDLLYDQQRYLEAVGFYRQALEVKPQDANARTDMGIALLYLGRNREAVEAFDRAIQDVPGHALAHYNLGVALAQGGEPAQAIAELQKALDLSAAGGGDVPADDARALIDQLRQEIQATP
jgi:tetratricopeptide (TPR) repeat protein